MSEDATFEKALTNSIAYEHNYGDLIFVFKNRGQFEETDSQQKIHYPQTDSQKYEIFHSGVWGDRHYGIRTGIPSTEIDGMIVKDALINKPDFLDTIYFTIAQNGFYIPVYNSVGEIIFTPEQYEEYKINRGRIEQVLANPQFGAEVFIEVLKESLFFKKQFESSVHVSQGYNLEQHTRLVLKQYEKYFGDRFTSPLLTENQFKLFLVLHDWGKRLAIEFLNDKSAQHEFNIKFLPLLLETLNIEPRVAEIITGLAGQDILGEYMQGAFPAEQAGRQLNAKAHELGIPVTQLFELLNTFYLCDASSYTTDAADIGGLDRIFIFDPPSEGKKGNIKFSEEYQFRIDSLQPYLYLE